MTSTCPRCHGHEGQSWRSEAGRDVFLCSACQEAFDGNEPALVKPTTDRDTGRATFVLGLMLAASLALNVFLGGLLMTGAQEAKNQTQRQRAK